MRIATEQPNLEFATNSSSTPSLVLDSQGRTITNGPAIIGGAATIGGAAAVGGNTTIGGSLQVAADRPINAQTGTAYTLAIADAGARVTLSNASAITLTVPPNSSVAFLVGCSIELAQLGAGLVTVAAGGGVTVDQVAGTLKLLGQYSVATLRKVAVNTWLLNGDVSAT